MRSPGGYAVAVRKADGSIKVKKEPLVMLSERSKLFKLPFIRGIITLISALYLGVKTLQFSADELAADMEAQEAEKARKEGKEAPKAKAPNKNGGTISTMEATMTLAVSFGLALLLFVALPHGITWLIGSKGPIGFSETSVAFHAVDGVVKGMIFIAYLWGIGRMKEIQRVFEYHGAEHKTIYSYEKGMDLAVENSRVQSRFHPRCGTSFLFFLILISIIFPAIIFPAFMPLEDWSRLGRNAAYIGMKILFTVPIAGIAYECIRLSARRPGHPLVRLAIAPGLALQRITTREPDDAQLEVAIRATAETLAYESVAPAACSVAAAAPVHA